MNCTRNFWFLVFNLVANRHRQLYVELYIVKHEVYVYLLCFKIQVGALFSLSCIITPVAEPAPSQLNSQRWRESIARRPKSVPGNTIFMYLEFVYLFILVEWMTVTVPNHCLWAAKLITRSPLIEMIQPSAGKQAQKWDWIRKKIMKQVIIEPYGWLKWIEQEPGSWD